MEHIPGSPLIKSTIQLFKKHCGYHIRIHTYSEISGLNKNNLNDIFRHTGIYHFQIGVLLVVHVLLTECYNLASILVSLKHLNDLHILYYSCKYQIFLF